MMGMLQKGVGTVTIQRIYLVREPKQMFFPRLLDACTIQYLCARGMNTYESLTGFRDEKVSNRHCNCEPHKTLLRMFQ
jgi:hypothetical protein